MKPWFKSKTFWVNLITVVIGFLTYIVGLEFIPDSVVAIITALVTPVLNLLLRWLTDTPITSVFKGADKLRPGVMERASKK